MKNNAYFIYNLHLKETYEDKDEQKTGDGTRCCIEDN